MNSVHGVADIRHSLADLSASLMLVLKKSNSLFIILLLVYFVHSFTFNVSWDTVLFSL